MCPVFLTPLVGFYLVEEVGAPKNGPHLLRRATIAERKPPRCCGASVSQRRGTMGAKPAFIPGALIWIPSLPLALVHKQPPPTHPLRPTMRHAGHNGANNAAAVSPLLLTNSGGCLGQNGAD